GLLYSSRAMTDLEPGASELASGAYGCFEGSPNDHVVFGTYRSTGTWSPQLVSLIGDRLLAGSGTLIDVGAHIRLVAIAALARGATRCIAFEPAPENFARLCRNVRRHGLESRVEAHAMALDAATGDVELALSPDNSGDHRIVHGDTPAGRPRIHVPAARLDDV